MTARSPDFGTDQQGANFVHPRYDSAGFASLPAYLTDLLTGDRDAVVAFLLIDGFGWRFFEQFQEEPFLQRIIRQGQVRRLSAQFPSTTAAHMTTLHTGQPVGEHGILEWNYYEPTLDAVITPLLFSYAGTSERETLKSSGVRPASLFPGETIYRDWKKAGVVTTVFQHRAYTPSSYSKTLLRGATVHSYKTIAEALINLSRAIEEAQPPACFVLYYDQIDSVSHEYGPTAPQTQAEIRHFLLALEHIFTPSLRPSRRTRFLLTADHGQAETDPATTLYLNREARFAGLERFLRTDGQGRPLVPGGSPRDFFLYIREGMVDEAQAFLARRLEGKAEVRRVDDLARAGYFGPRLSSRFRARAGDLVILPYRGESVWWYEKDRFEQKYYGHHGGLTPQEMDIPLLCWEMEK